MENMTAPTPVMHRIDLARELAARGITLQNIVLATGLPRHIAFLAIKAEAIKAKAERDGKQQQHESAKRTVARRRQTREEFMERIKER